MAVRKGGEVMIKDILVAAAGIGGCGAGWAARSKMQKSALGRRILKVTERS
jgi:hypothetical protein